MARKEPPCPCGTGRSYATCCGPYHAGDVEPPDAEALMRSRFSAFAMKHVDHLYRTMHRDHPDRQRSEAEVKAALRESARTLRYMGLTILDRALPGDTAHRAQVLFLARVFYQGGDRSFVERSVFAHDGVGWRYLDGVGATAATLRIPATSLTLATFDDALPA